MIFSNSFLRLLIITLVTLGLAACGQRDDAPRTEARDYAVVTANQLATQAGADVLADGGSAIDAAIAIQAVLSLVEPQSSGLGGGAFMLYYDAASGEVMAFDGRETAPRAMRPDQFLNDDGTPKSFFEVVATGEAVGVPGVLAMLADAHEDFGILPWRSLFDDAVQLSENGFEVSPRLHRLIGLAPWTAQMPDSRAYLFSEDGAPLATGTLLRNQDYADTLRLIARGGPGVMYEGELAQAIVDEIQNAPTVPGVMTLADLAHYEPVRREPVCSPYRTYRICGMGPPSSGATTMQMILGLLEPYDLSAVEPGSPLAVHLISEASRLAYADRDMYLADSDFVAVPVEGLLDTDYLAERRARIQPGRSMGIAEAGNPWPEQFQPRAPDVTPDVPGTSHFVVVDSFGNALTMTTSVESIFGSNMMVGGFFLNNQLTDFSFEPQRDGASVANAPAPGKRPRSSMSPTMIFDADGNLFALLGSAGGSRIPAYVAQTAIALIDWDMSMEDALALPHHVNRNGPVELEAGTTLEAIAPTLRALGHDVNMTTLNSGTQGVRVLADGFDTGADPRREGTASARCCSEAAE